MLRRLVGNMFRQSPERWDWSNKQITGVSTGSRTYQDGALLTSEQVHRSAVGGRIRKLAVCSIYQLLRRIHNWEPGSLFALT